MDGLVAIGKKPNTIKERGNKLKWKIEKTVNFTDELTNEEIALIGELSDCAYGLKSVKDKTGLTLIVKELFGYLKI